MPATGRDRNDSSSEEESDDEVIIQPRRSSGFRVLGAPPAANPQAAKAAVLGQIQNMASQIQANEVVTASTQATQKTEEEKKALEERQRMLQQQQIAKAQQAAAIQAAAARVAQANKQNAGSNEVDIQAKEQAARAQADAERRAAEARQAQAKALQAAQEQAKRAQEEALRKAQESKAMAEDQARALKQQQDHALAAQKAQVEAQARAQAEANAKAAAARKAQQETQARAQLDAQNRMEAAKKAQAEAQARAQAEAQARSQALKAQQDAQIKANAQAQAQAKAQAEAQAKAQAQARAQAQAKAQADAQAKAKAQAEAQAKAQAHAKAQAEAQAKSKAQAEAQSKSRQQQQQVAQNMKPAVASTNTRVAPAIPQKKQTGQNLGNVQSTPGSSSTGMHDSKKELQGSVPSSELQTTGATLIHHAPRPTGNKPTWNPVIKSVPQKDLGPLDRNGPLKQTAKAQEEQSPNSEICAAPPTVGVSAAQKPAIRQENVVEKFVEKQQPVPEPTQRAGVQMLAGAERWERDSTIREQQATTMGGENTEKPAAVRLQDDSCWMTQHRQPVEIQPPQVGKVTIPELSEGHAVQKTVIVTKPQSYQKVKWNEFPEELKPEIGHAPKVQTQEWVPVNQEQQDLQRSLYKPARISRVWPPPEDTLSKETAPMTAVKASDDNAWIQQENNEVLRSAAWSSTAAKINRVWPPPEEDGSDRGYAGPQHMPAVQWPPSESEQHEREQVEVLQKHLPTKKIERQWPPPPPQYQEVPVNEVITNQTQQGVLAK